MVETDASKYGIRAILQQDGHPIAYVNKALALQHHALSTYEKEFVALLLGRRFTKVLNMEQRILTPLQQKFMTKLLPNDFEVHYKRGRENTVVDGLSRLPEGQIALQAAFTITSPLIQEI